MDAELHNEIIDVFMAHYGTKQAPVCEILSDLASVACSLIAAAIVSGGPEHGKIAFEHFIEEIEKGAGPNPRMRGMN